MRCERSGRQADHCRSGSCLRTRFGGSKHHAATRWAECAGLGQSRQRLAEGIPAEWVVGALLECPAGDLWNLAVESLVEWVSPMTRGAWSAPLLG